MSDSFTDHYNKNSRYTKPGRTDVNYYNPAAVERKNDPQPSVQEEPKPEKKKAAVPPPEPEVMRDEPWEEHDITFNMDKIEAAGFKGGVQRYQKPSGLKVYKVFMSPGKNAMEYKVDAMLMLGFAMKKAKDADVPPTPPVATVITPVPEPAPTSVPTIPTPTKQEEEKPEDIVVAAPTPAPEEKENSIEMKEETPVDEWERAVPAKGEKWNPVEEAEAEDAPEEEETGDLWTEDKGYEIDEEELREAGYVSVEKKDKDDKKQKEHKYVLKRADGKERVVTGELLKEVFFLKRKTDD